MNYKKNLDLARKLKNDEFFTKYEDIKKELINYKNFLKGKKIVCPCDNGNSNFVKFLNDVKIEWNIKSIDYFADNFENVNYENYDVIITNPPFSLFRKFIKKIFPLKFIIIAPFTVITYKDFFPLIRDKKVNIGFNKINSFDNINKKVNCFWITNFNIDNKELKELILTTKTDEIIYIENNLNLLVIDKVKNIPYDYNGVMAVPINIMNYNLERGGYKIISLSRYYKYGNKAYDLVVDNKITFMKIIIQKEIDEEKRA